MSSSTVSAPAASDQAQVLAPPPDQLAEAAPQTADAVGGEAQDGRKSAVADSSLRIDVGILDKLMNLVGELVLARNQILQFTSQGADAAFVSATQRLNLVTSELQEGVMKTRMQPIGNIWSKFPRVVRDVATLCGKQVRIEMDGKDTELDKTIIEAIKDPLTHIIRNSVDHGIESPEVRVARGKGPEGLLRLRAYHEGGHINIEIVDDGAGIDPNKIRAVALRRGVVTAELAGRMSDQDAVRLIFQPGFSTAEKVSNISGRGVGMDVVKTNIERIGGQVDIHSQVGEGTTIRIKIPLTLAIIPALIVTSAGARYAIPQVNLLELVRLDEGTAATAVERIDDGTFYRLRGNLLPLVWLRRELNLADSDSAGQAVNIVVLKADERRFGLVVDRINDTEEIVVKPLSRQLKSISMYAGATIMGDGAVALILDVLGLAQRARVVSATRGTAHTETAHVASAGVAVSDAGRQTLLVFGVSGGDRMAIPLSQVTRLEEFSGATIEHAGGREVVQYGDEIMPLVSPFGGDCLPSLDEAGGTRRAIVLRHNTGHVAMVVDEIIDIVSERISGQRGRARHGALGSVVIQERVTELVDVDAMLASVGRTTFECVDMATGV